jgi:large subunit ribosomal protein L10
MEPDSTGSARHGHTPARVQSTISPGHFAPATGGSDAVRPGYQERAGWQGFCPSVRRKGSNGMDRKEKSEVVSALNASLQQMGVVVITRNLGMTVSQSTDLRQKMRDAGAAFRVTKNRLAKIAIEGTDYAGISSMLTGPVGLATSTDPVAAAKVAVDFAKTNDRLEIVGGAMGTQLLDAEGIKALASLPSLDELRAKIVGLLVAPATKLATVTQAPAAKLARVFNAYAEKDAA